jgi:pimeloyl-ACP methyl ester carboxylesterase
MRTWRSLVVLCLPLCLQGAACATQDSPDTGQIEVAAQVSLLRNACTDSFNSVYAKPPNNLPPFDNSRRGDIVRCAKGEEISKNALQNALNEAAFTNVQAKNGLRVLRFSYRTKRAVRGGDVGTALLVLPTSNGNQNYRTADELDVAANDYALLGGAGGPAEASGAAARPYVPSADEETERNGGNNQKPPVILFAHGTAPYRTDCGYSKSKPLTATFLGYPDLELRMVLALASQGSPVVMPDYAGYAKDSFASGYMLAEDEAYSVLDATRALKKLFDNYPDNVAFVGHSQGGHAVLSAQSYVKSYGMAGNLRGVVALAPFWAPSRLFGIIAHPESGYTTADDLGRYALNTAVQYFYTHAELLDGKGKGNQLLTFDINALIGATAPACDFFPPIQNFGLTGADLFKGDFATTVGDCAFTGACPPTVPQTWGQRFAKDRPVLDKKGAPVLLWQGVNDQTVIPSIVACGTDKIRQDFSGSGATAKLKVCADTRANSSHDEVQNNNAAHVLQWIKARTQGGAEPNDPNCKPEADLGASCFLGNFD